MAINTLLHALAPQPPISIIRPRKHQFVHLQMQCHAQLRRSQFPINLRDLLQAHLIVLEADMELLITSTKVPDQFNSNIRQQINNIFTPRLLKPTCVHQTKITSTCRSPWPKVPLMGDTPAGLLIPTKLRHPKMELHTNMEVEPLCRVNLLLRNRFTVLTLLPLNLDLLTQRQLRPCSKTVEHTAFRMLWDKAPR